MASLSENQCRGRSNNRGLSILRDWENFDLELEEFSSAVYVAGKKTIYLSKPYSRSIGTLNLENGKCDKIDVRAKPYGMTALPGTKGILFVDKENSCVQKLNLSTHQCTVYADSDGLHGANCGSWSGVPFTKLQDLAQLAHDPHTGDLFVSKGYFPFHKLYWFQAASRTVAKIPVPTGELNSGATSFAFSPSSRELYVAHSYHSGIVALKPALNIQMQARRQVTEFPQLDCSEFSTVAHGNNGTMYVALNESGDSRCRIFAVNEQSGATETLTDLKDSTYPLCVVKNQLFLFHERSLKVADISGFERKKQGVLCDKNKKRRLNAEQEKNEDKQNVEELEKKVKSLNSALDGFLCKICLEENVSILFNACNHMVTCETCSSKVQKCPVCRKDISLTEKEPRMRVHI